MNPASVTTRPVSRWHNAGLKLGIFALAGLGLCVLKVILFGIGNEPDLVLASPTGNYVATMERHSTGGAGGASMVELRPSRFLSAGFTDGEIVAYGGASTIASMKWIGPHHLEITTTYPLTKPQSRWHDVVLTYRLDSDWAHAVRVWAKQ